MKRTILILNGPGLADRDDHGSDAGTASMLRQIEEECAELCSGLGIDMEFRQADDPDAVYRWIESDAKAFDGIVFNPVEGSQATSNAGHARQAALKVLATLRKPVIEVHLDNLFKANAGNGGPVHEAIGHGGLVCGLGIDGYLLGIRSLVHSFEPGARS